LLSLVLLGWPVVSLVRRARRKHAASSGLRRFVPWAIWLAGLLAVGFGLALGASVASTFASQPALIMLGLPAGAAWLFLLPKLLALLVAAGMVALLVAWRGAGWSRWVRLHYAVSLGAGAYFVLFLLRTGLF